jgi:hypothetical protein
MLRRGCQADIQNIRTSPGCQFGAPGAPAGDASGPELPLEFGAGGFIMPGNLG